MGSSFTIAAPGYLSTSLNPPSTERRVPSKQHRPSLNLLMAAMAALVSSSAAGSLRADEPNIWDQAISRQPFEAAPFRRVKIPEWVWDTVGVGYTLSGQNSEQRSRAAAAGVSISELNFVDPFYPYYDSRLLQKRSPHVPLGRLEKDIAEYQRLGIRILAVYPPSLQGEVYEKHPDWRRISTNTRDIPQIDMKRYPH